MIKRVLVINDANDSLKMVEEALAYEHFEVKIIADDEAIMPALATFKPDLLIIDHKLATAFSANSYGKIKADPRFENISVIICSAYVHTDDECISGCECDAVIAKPFGLQELLDKIKHLTTLQN